MPLSERSLIYIYAIFTKVGAFNTCGALTIWDDQYIFHIFSWAFPKLHITERGDPSQSLQLERSTWSPESLTRAPFRAKAAEQKRGFTH